MEHVYLTASHLSEASNRLDACFQASTAPNSPTLPCRKGVGFFCMCINTSIQSCKEKKKRAYVNRTPLMGNFTWQPSGRIARSAGRKTRKYQQKAFMKRQVQLDFLKVKDRPPPF